MDHKRQKIRKEIYFQRSLTGTMSPKCPICLDDLFNSFDMHEVFLTRGNVVGLPLELRTRIFVPENVSLVHHGECHEIAATQKGKIRCISDIIFWEDYEKVLEFLYRMREYCAKAQQEILFLENTFYRKMHKSVVYRLIPKWGYTPSMTYNGGYLWYCYERLTLGNYIRDAAAEYGVLDYMRGKDERIEDVLESVVVKPRDNGELYIIVRGIGGRKRVMKEIVARAILHSVMTLVHSNGRCCELKIEELK